MPVTITVVLDTHPFSGLVADSVYLPGTFTAVFLPFALKPCGPSQEKTSCLEADVPSSDMLGVLQESEPDTEAKIPLGVIVSWLTFTNVFLIHPLAMPVTVTS